MRGDVARLARVILTPRETSWIAPVPDSSGSVSPMNTARSTTVQVLARGPIEADVDERRVERILRNLVVNAIEHGEGKPVTIHLRTEGGAVAVVVEDHGVGLRQGEASMVFTRFWRADPARARTTGGTGLGLAIALEDARLRMFGGSSMHWGGRCRELDAENFESLPFETLRGWPISKTDLDPYQAETDTILDLIPVADLPDIPVVQDWLAEFGVGHA